MRSEKTRLEITSHKDYRIREAEIKLLTQLLMDGESNTNKILLAHILHEVEQGRSFTRSVVGIRPLPNNADLKKTWYVAYRSDEDYVTIKFLSLKVGHEGFGWLVKQGLMFQGAVLFDEQFAIQTAFDLKRNSPEIASCIYLYNPHTGEEQFITN